MTFGMETDEPKTAQEVIERARAIKARFERLERMAKHNNVRIEREKREAKEAGEEQRRQRIEQARRAEREAIMRKMEEDFQRFLAMREHDRIAIDSGPSRRAIVTACAKIAGVTANDIAGPWRNAKVVAARQMVFWVLRNSTQLSLTQIGSYVGNRDHTTILHGIRRIDYWLGERADAVKRMHYEDQIAAVWAVANPKNRLHGNCK